jgi:hypothetical protein
MFIATSRGFVTLSLVQHIRAPAGGLVRFMFSGGEFVDLPEQEAQGIETVMLQEMLIAE